MDTRGKILRLMEGQRLAVIATPSEGHPYTNLVAFIHDPGLKWIAFATFRNTRKFRNIEADPRISILIDNRKNTPEDLGDAVTLTALGTADPDNNGPELRELFLNRHPGLQAFINDPRCSIVRVRVREYIFVSNFQETESFFP